MTLAFALSCLWFRLVLPHVISVSFSSIVPHPHLALVSRLISRLSPHFTSFRRHVPLSLSHLAPSQPISSRLVSSVDVSSILLTSAASSSTVPLLHCRSQPRVGCPPPPAHPTPQQEPALTSRVPGRAGLAPTGTWASPDRLSVPVDADDVSRRSSVGGPRGIGGVDVWPTGLIRGGGVTRGSREFAVAQRSAGEELRDRIWRKRQPASEHAEVTSVYEGLPATAWRRVATGAAAAAAAEEGGSGFVEAVCEARSGRGERAGGRHRKLYPDSPAAPGFPRLSRFQQVT